MGSELLPSSVAQRGDHRVAVARRTDRVCRSPDRPPVGQMALLQFNFGGVSPELCGSSAWYARGVVWDLRPVNSGMPAGSFGHAGLRLNGVLLWVLFGLGVGGLVLTFVGEVWSWLPYAFGGVASAVVFLHWPWLRPPYQDRRGPPLVLAGRTLVALLWLVRIGLTGLCGFLLAGIPAGQDFDLRLAVGAVIGWATLVLHQLGRWMTGFRRGLTFGSPAC